MINTIISELKTAADPDRQKTYKTMFPTSMEYLGVRTSRMRQLLKNWWADIKDWSPEKLIDFAKELVDSNNFEANQLAFELLWKNKAALNQLNINDLEYLGKNMDNWATTDSFSVMLSGWAWRNNQISDNDILRWLETGNRWWRRAAVVSTVGLNLKSRGGTGDTRRTLMICEKVIHDRDDMMVKALSWALRELSKSDKPTVQNFMKKYDTQIPGRVRREVYTKLETGKKNR
ncbi:MAG TPA: DNA alkylation repair protein [Draconibacterium sp.]|nr:DNA alkylation repair protein [Draconibacterium sp.]